jgi:type I site-specific restriction-modification system R (restriction) subunit
MARRISPGEAETKDFGYIVDHKDLFTKVENAIAVYSSELDHSAGGAAPEVLLQDRLKKGKERLDIASVLGVAVLVHEVDQQPVVKRATSTAANARLDLGASHHRSSCGRPMASICAPPADFQIVLASRRLPSNT